ncbi:hypothetical protein ACVIM9_004458 [Bradyrhizobium sp. USDA 4520]
MARPALVDAEHRQGRDQHRSSEQERRGALEERTQPQPEIQADAAMYPGDHQHRQHLPQPVRRGDEEGVQLLWVELLLPVQGLAEPYADDVCDDQHRDAEAERQLQRLDRLPVELAALIERPDAEPSMHQAGAVEHDRDRQELPELGVVVDPDRQRLRRDIAERVVEEMAGQVGEHDRPRDDADLPQADTAGHVLQVLARGGGHVIHDRQV